jgi:hypothetical protein
VGEALTVNLIFHTGTLAGELRNKYTIKVVSPL